MPTEYSAVDGAISTAYGAAKLLSFRAADRATVGTAEYSANIRALKSADGAALCSAIDPTDGAAIQRTVEPAVCATQRAAFL